MHVVYIPRMQCRLREAQSEHAQNQKPYSAQHGSLPYSLVMQCAHRNGATCTLKDCTKHKNDSDTFKNLCIMEAYGTCVAILKFILTIGSDVCLHIDNPRFVTDRQGIRWES